MSPEPEKIPVKKTYRPGMLASAVLFLTLAVLWYDLSETKSVQKEQAEQNQQLAAALAATRSELASARTELDFFKTGDSRPSGKQAEAKPARTAAIPVEEPETLFLQAPAVSQNDSGLSARFGFTPEAAAELPETITLVIRIPTRADAQILSLKPVNESAYSQVEFLVNAKGNLGMIEGSPSDLLALEFELIVSEPVKATVRGSTGIKAFEMDISETGCTVRTL